jgi:hypothetical protein
MTPLIGFAPDLDPATPGAITNCSQLIPTLKGMAGAPTPIDAGLDTLADDCRGAAYVTRLDAVRRLFAGTGVKLYELAGTAWTDVSKVGGYTSGAENIWRFAQFGNASLATNQTDKIQYSTSGAFDDIAQAPKARIIETASGFVMAFCIDDATVGGERSDAWWCSNIYDYATWTPSSSNQAAFGYLLDTPGEIRAAKRFGQDIVVYKERSMYLGQYIGPPVIWSFQLISSDIGALSQESVVDTGNAQLFISRDDFWLYDGSRPRSIGAPIREWFFNNSDSSYRYQMKSYYDKFKGLVWWFYAPNGSAGAMTEAIVYNINSNRWGLATVTIQAVLDYYTAETTWDNWPPGPATDYDNIVDVAFDSPLFDNDSSTIAVFGSDNKVATLAGPCGASTMTTGDIGDDTVVTTVTAVKPRFVTSPATSQLTNYTKMESDAALVTGNTSARNGNKFDVLASARWHRFKLETTGDFEIIGATVDMSEDGEE